MRTSILSAMAGLFAAGLAFAALRQASLARNVHSYQKDVDWSKAYSEASRLITDSNPTLRLAGVIGVCKLAGNPGRDSSSVPVNVTLASFIRAARENDADAVYLALQFLCENRDAATYSLKGARLTGLDLTSFNLDGFDLTAASFRDSIVNLVDKDRISSFAGVDVGGVNWVKT